MLFKQNGNFVLRSGALNTVKAPPVGIRPIVHSHPTDAFGVNSLLPSRADINVLNNFWNTNPNGVRPVSQIITGEGQTTIFRATGLDLIPKL